MGLSGEVKYRWAFMITNLPSDAGLLHFSLFGGRGSDKLASCHSNPKGYLGSEDILGS